jgi:retron-type reverse transcriptase
VLLWHRYWEGQTISPLLANIYLHYILDQWFEGG